MTIKKFKAVVLVRLRVTNMSLYGLKPLKRNLLFVNDEIANCLTNVRCNFHKIYLPDNSRFQVLL